MIRDLCATAASRADAEAGLLAYLRFETRGLVVDGVTLRRTADGRLALSWPERRARDGARHPVVRPANGAARAALEADVFAELRRQGAIR